MKKIKNVAIVYRARTPEAFQMAKELTTWLKGHKLNVFGHPEQKPLPGAKKISSPKQLDELDLVVVLGGDGTYLFAASLLDGRPAPMLGVNMGSLGFLTETRKEDLYKAMELALKNKLQESPRTLLEVDVIKKGKRIGHYRALNDVVIERGNYSRLINLAIFSDDQLVSELKADGLIIATPTGSTAYNMAASGPIMHPTTRAVVLTPICPHSLTNRPIILPDEHEIRLRINQEAQKGYFMIDGQKHEMVGPNDEVLIRKSKVQHLLLRTPSTSYFDLLKTKLQFGQRN